MNSNTIIIADSLTELKKIPTESVDLIFADPPYFMQTDGVLLRPEGSKFSGCDDEWDKFEDLKNYENFSQIWLSECQRILKPNGAIWVIGSMQCIYLLGAIMQKLGFWLINDVIWHKSNPTPNFKGTRLCNAHETLIWAAKSKKSKFTFNYKTAKELNCDIAEFSRGKRLQMGSVWRFAVCSGNERLKDENGEKLHNTQKPLALIERIIAISSRFGDTILDPFAGTFTTAAAAKKLGRKFICIEKSEKYAKFGRARIEKIAPELNEIALAKFDEKPKKAQISDMIRDGFFILGEKFYLEDKFAILQSSGKLEFNGEICDMHSLCARIKAAKSARLNGWKHWKVRRNGEFILIDEIRQSYRERNSN